MVEETLIFLIIMVVFRGGHVVYNIIKEKYNIENTFFLQNSLMFEVCSLFAMFILVLNIKKFLKILRTSYEIDNNKIVKGTLKNFPYTGNLIRPHAFDRDFDKVKYNLKSEFVNVFFDSDAYEKEIYINPLLSDETEKTLTYICDNQKN